MDCIRSWVCSLLFRAMFCSSTVGGGLNERVRTQCLLINFAECRCIEWTCKLNSGRVILITRARRLVTSRVETTISRFVEWPTTVHAEHLQSDAIAKKLPYYSNTTTVHSAVFLKTRALYGRMAFVRVRILSVGRAINKGLEIPVRRN